MSLLTRTLFLVATIVVVLVLERLRPADRGRRGEWATNVLAFGLNLAGFLASAAVLGGAVAGLVNDVGGGLIDLRSWPLAAGATVYLVAMDFGEYLFHRAQHAIPWLWEMHSLHHSDGAMNLSTTERHFWLDPALKTGTVWLAVGLLFRANPAIMAVYFLAGLANFLNHANIRLGFGPLSWLWNSPQYHRLHHSSDPAHYNANFAALLPIFDVIAGSYRRPAPGEFPPTGLGGPEPRPLDLVVWPWRPGRSPVIAAAPAAAAPVQAFEPGSSAGTTPALDPSQAAQARAA